MLCEHNQNISELSCTELSCTCCLGLGIFVTSVDINFLHCWVLAIFVNIIKTVPIFVLLMSKYFIGRDFLFQFIYLLHSLNLVC